MGAATAILGVCKVVACQWVTAPQCAGGGDGGVEVGYARQRWWWRIELADGETKVLRSVSASERQQP